MLNDCEKLKAKRRNDPEAGKRRQDKDTDDFEGAAFSACFVAHFLDSSSVAADDSPSGETWQFVRPKAIIRNKPADKSVCPGGTVAVPVQNSFDILCDSNDSSNDAGDLPAAATPVEGLHSSTEYSSPFSASTYEVGESSGTSAPAADSVPGYFQSPPDLPTNSLKHPLVWDFLLGQWTDPEAYPSIKTRRSDPYSGMMHNSVIAIEDCDLSDSVPPDLATPYRNFWVSLRSNFHVDTPPAPGVRPVHSPEPARVTVEDFELPRTRSVPLRLSLRHLRLSASLIMRNVASGRRRALLVAIVSLLPWIYRPRLMTCFQVIRMTIRTGPPTAMPPGSLLLIHRPLIVADCICGLVLFDALKCCVPLLSHARILCT